MYIVCFKQKTAYEMRISDWSSDVCSSDLIPASSALNAESCSSTWSASASFCATRLVIAVNRCSSAVSKGVACCASGRPSKAILRGRKSVVEGKRVSVRVDSGGRRIINKKQTYHLLYSTRVMNTKNH